MIYTVTLNPALDYIVSVKDFQQGATNRTNAEKILPGGKGINVSIVLQNLGFSNTALGFVAGFTGEEIIRLLGEYSVKSDFIKVDQGMSRINVKLQTHGLMVAERKNVIAEPVETEINGIGPKIQAFELAQLMNRLDELGAGDVLFLAGSIPASLPADIYRNIMERLQGRKVQIVVDATKELLLNVLEYHPFLIKPNQHEIEDIFGVSLCNKQEILAYAKKLQEMGACNVMVSMGAEGAVLLTEDGQVLEASAPKGRLVNAVGAGDSMVAAFMAGWLDRQDYNHAFKMGVAAGSASAFSDKLATSEEVTVLYDKIDIFQIFP